MFMLKSYYYLTKPGIIYGNAVTATAGFFLASGRSINIQLFIAMLLGLSLVIASACVINNLFDADIDSKMERTKNRSLVTGEISFPKGVIFGSILLLLGGTILYFYTSLAAFWAAGLGVFFYLFLYSPLKRKTVHATLIGAVAGATPPVVGYVSKVNQIDTAAIILFLILVFWQMAHFYSIAIRRIEEYKSAGISIMPIRYGVRSTKIQILVYILAFTVACTSLTYFGYTKYVYLFAVAILGTIWFLKGMKGFKVSNESEWAKKMFLFSLIVITFLCIFIIIDAIIGV